jgi:hypothetical protein
MVKKDSAISRIKKACVSRWESAMAGLWSSGGSVNRQVAERYASWNTGQITDSSKSLKNTNSGLLILKRKLSTDDI